MEGVAADIRRSSGVAPEERSRAAVYSLLGALLAAPPVDEVVGMLRSIAGAEDRGAPMVTAWRTLQQAATRVPPSLVEEEYQDLFIGVGRGELLPYCSPYVTGFLNDRPLVQLRSDLSRLGLKRRASCHEPEDHIAALCEVMAYLISHPADYRLDDQKQFFECHLLPWAGRFMGDLQTAKAADFYSAVGGLGVEFFTLETRYFHLST